MRCTGTIGAVRDLFRLQLLLATFAGWVNRHQAQVMHYLVEENRVLKEQLGKRRLRLKRWLIDMAKCYPYSRLHEAYCHICVDVCPYVHKANGDGGKRRMFKAYMKQRKEDGYRSPNRL